MIAIQVYDGDGVKYTPLLRRERLYNPDGIIDDKGSMTVDGVTYFWYFETMDVELVTPTGGKHLSRNERLAITKRNQGEPCVDCGHYFAGGIRDDRYTTEGHTRWCRLTRRELWQFICESKL